MSGIKMLICLLWGNTALDNQQITTKGTNSYLWHVTEVNAVAIAFAAIVPVGSKSGINYMADFKYYTKRIEDQLKKGTKLMHDTLKFYNDHVFPPMQNCRSRAVTTIPVSLTEEEENFWHKIEVLDKSKESDNSDFDSTDQTDTAPADPLSTFSLEPTLPVLPMMNVPLATSESVQAQIPLQPVSTMSEAVHLKTADHSDRVQSKAKGRKGSGPAMPRVTRKQKEGKNSAMAGPGASGSVGHAKSAASLPKAITFAPVPMVVTDVAPNRTFIGDNVDQSDDEYDSEEEEEEEKEEV
ncbi:hypothetical protein IW262DRAFT_1529054 [Armillaria fumosa]|nr:hypothetical protein IW262DRAFT_1529054 [Armillaria fumosa]